jgi:Flp pilus assembly protein TadG
MAARSVARAMRARNAEDERGFVIVWMVVVLVVLLAVAAFAVDLVHAYANAQKLQNAVDAASLGGAIELPHALDDSAAIARATALMAENDFPIGGPNQVVTLGQTGPNEVTVDVKHTFGTFFAKVIGVDALTVRRKGVAQYDPPVAMGSATNNLGDVPSCPPTSPPAVYPACVTGGLAAAQQHLWAQIQGPDAGGHKAHGNPYTNHSCDPGQPADGCTGSTNDEEDTRGQFFRIRNDQPGPLDIWIYDPGFVHTTPSCGAPPFSAPPPLSWNDGDPEHIARLVNYGNTAFCPGDTQFGAPPTTTFRLLGPDATPDPDPTNNPVACDNGGSPYTFTGYDSPDTAHAQLPGDLTAQAWHSWWKLCTIPAAATLTDNEFLLEVKSPSGAGTNHFSILALHNNLPTPQLTVFTRIDCR